MRNLNLLALALTAFVFPPHTLFGGISEADWQNAFTLGGPNNLTNISLAASNWSLTTVNSNPFPNNSSQTDIIATSLGGGIQVTIDSKIANEFEYPIGNGNISFDGSLLGDVAGNAEITFTFSTPIYGFGANFEGLDPNQEVSLGLSASQLVTNGFVGIESSTPFSSITLYDQGFYTFTGSRSPSTGFTMSNLMVSTTPTPEPTSVALIGLGLIAAGATHLRRRKSTKA